MLPEIVMMNKIFTSSYWFILFYRQWGLVLIKLYLIIAGLTLELAKFIIEKQFHIR